MNLNKNTGFKMKILFLLASVCLSSTLLAAPLNYSIKNTKETAQKEQVAFTYQWMNTDHLDASYRNFLGIEEGSEVREVLIASSNFYLPKGLKNFKPEYFDDISILEKLSGMKYKKTNKANVQNITFKPHPLKTITAVSTVRVLKNSSVIDDLFSMEKTDERTLVHQTVNNFSAILDRTDIITEIKSENSGTRFTIHSIAVLNSSESQSSLLSITKSAMVAKMKEQMKQTPDIFFNN
jgi:hypothetical protein